jgi:hypothetical protein
MFLTSTVIADEAKHPIPLIMIRKSNNSTCENYAPRKPEGVHTYSKAECPIHDKIECLTTDDICTKHVRIIQNRVRGTNPIACENQKGYRKKETQCDPNTLLIHINHRRY